MTKSKPKIIATIGPSSISPNVLRSFKSKGVSYIRINLSHTKIDKIESTIKKMLGAGIKIVIDTEGSQVRTGDLSKTPLSFKEGDQIKIFNAPVNCNNKQFWIRPEEFCDFLTPGSLVSVDFDSVLLKIIETTPLKKGNFVMARVVIGGTIASNRAVHCDAVAKLPALSTKDLYAINIAKKYRIRCFTLSYIDNAQQVTEFKKLYPEAIAYSKIETKQAVVNFEKILEASDGLLIDRGDLGREVPPERIPLLTKAIIKKSLLIKKPVFIATNILENMCEHLKPNRAEINDIVNLLLDSVDGFVLTKETAVGKYPIETVNVLSGIISQTNILSDFRARNLLEISERDFSGGLIEPHGGILVDRYRVMEFTQAEITEFKKIYIDDETLMDLEQIAIGAYSPLEGFMNSLELNCVLDKMRLPSGLPWTMPIILTVNSKEAKRLKAREVIALVRSEDKEIYATMVVNEIKKLNIIEIAKKCFGTDDKKHPGVARFFEGGDYLIAGKINLLRRRASPFKEYELTPTQTRKIFIEKGWSSVVGFHSRNPIHRSHEYIQLQALKNIPAEGLFIHPVAGKKKKGDFEADVIIRVYELMMKKFYPKNKVVFALFPTYSRYAGPREAIFTAICRKNYGCSHFIIGRDHTGVGDYYSPLSSHEIFNKFPDLGITPVFFNQVYWSTRLKKYVMEGSVQEKPEDKAYISGTALRELFLAGRKPPQWLMRPEISKEIIKLNSQFRRKGRSIFIE